MQSIDDAIQIGVFIPPLADRQRHHVISRGHPIFYRPKDLKDKGPGKTAWVDAFEKIIVGLYLVLEGPVPYAFRTPDGKIRSLDAGCLKMLCNRPTPELEFNLDAGGFIDSIAPAEILLKRYERIHDRLMRQILEATAED